MLLVSSTQIKVAPPESVIWTGESLVDYLDLNQVQINHKSLGELVPN
jgi:hypothetical protein